MREISYVVTNRLGLHARCAGLFAQNAVEWKSAVTMACNEKEANAKQVLEILNLGVACGDEVCIRVEGVDEEKAAQSLAELLPSLFA